MGGERRTLLGALECLLLVSGGPVSPERLAGVMGCSVEEIRLLLEELQRTYEGRGLMVQEVGGGYQLCTRPEYGEFVRRFLDLQPEPLSRATLETLAIVAYRQPVTRAEIEAIRGARSDAHLRRLLDRGLIREVGRRAAPGHPVEYGTTELFLRRFGLRDLADLPPLGEIRVQDALRRRERP
ncbi:MAG: SMC-Scp complex subunit ScpB [Armatimonadota bacterium]|nr:SMC-Scp complex subunit ScpB [Armatimonadota bacterium]MDR7439364.1 SMC-Scp complex subunit ScpB [Armatimonadota bacterium]MDR7563203.1 SMC-Scp complex subunit ScpB [Armatimonadota bacterium]MDR7601893.1 SMC-Scp complex subunit ScpB [Armatimonadota bacterium]